VTLPTSEEVNKNTEAFIESIENGSFIYLDGVMSPQTRQLVATHGAVRADMTIWWSHTSQDWTCPACRRTKPEIVRLNTKNELICRLVEHHDHMQDLLVKRFIAISVSRNEVVADESAEHFAKRSASMVSSYDNTIICDDCNTADAHAKKVVGTDKSFSYSPNEIGKFVFASPNVSHKINSKIASEIWNESVETFRLRLKIIDRIADIAASNSHWFQETKLTNRPEHILRAAQSHVSIKQAYGALDLLCGPKKQQPARAASHWRHVKNNPNTSVPTQSEINHLARVSCAPQWKLVADDWVCPGCKRTKIETVRASNQFEWSFSVRDRWYFDRNAKWNKSRAYLCNDCILTSADLRKEILATSEVTTDETQKFISVEDIERIVIGRPHSRHMYNDKDTDKVIAEIIERITLGRI
jgi:rubredoxin